MAQQIISTNTFTTAKWIVSNNVTTGAYDGTHTTIAAALTSAASGDTIFIRPGTYTENLTLKAGVNLTAFGSDSSGNGTGKVIISGTCTLTTAGSVTISGIQLQTNSAALLAVTGTLASVVNLKDCYLNCTNTTGITFSSSSASAQVNMYNCNGDIGTTGIALFSHSSGGDLTINDCTISNSGGTSTNSTCSAGRVFLRYAVLYSPITTSSTGVYQGQYSSIDSSAQTATCLTIGGGTSNSFHCTYITGNIAAISISATLQLYGGSVQSSSTSTITGAGTVNYGNIAFPGSQRTINVTTQSGGTIYGGVTQAPSVGYLGESIRTFTALASEVTLTTTTGKTVASISLTAGIWDVTGIIGYDGNAATSSTQFYCAISTVDNTVPANTTYGDAVTIFSCPATVGLVPSLTVPSYRVTITTTTTYYLVAFAIFSINSMKAYGRISATRVG